MVVSGIFSEYMKTFFGAEEGAYTSMTQMEIEKQTFNVKKEIRDLLVRRMGSLIPLHDKNIKTRFQLSQYLFDKYSVSEYDILCKYSKPVKNEMTIYFSHKLFLPKSDICDGDVWCIYFKTGDSRPWFGYLSKDQWDLFNTPFVGGSLVEMDEKTLSPDKKIVRLEYSVPVTQIKVIERMPPAPRGKHSYISRSGCRVPSDSLKTINENNKIKGNRGEEIVFIHEKDRLKAEGQKDLAKKVEWTAKKWDGLGYDIKSYKKNCISGHYEDIYIEVKTSSNGYYSPFYASINEIDVSKQKGNSYYLYRVTNMTKDGDAVNIYKQQGPINSSFSLTAQTYKAYPK